MRTKMRLLSIIAFGCIAGWAVLLGGCAGSKSIASPEANSTSPATPATVEKSVAPASATPLPAEPTATPTPSVLNPDGPYILFEGYGGIWITNPDGSVPTRLSDQGLSSPFQDFHRTVSPDGKWFVQVISNEAGADLVVFSLPYGNPELVAHLADRPSPEEMTTLSGLAWHAILRYDTVAWQPGDSRLLAFVGAMDGPTGDLYVYDTQTKEITRLTSGPSQALSPIWSPDGRYILHFGGSWVEPIGGALTEYNRADGAWAVRVEDGVVITQPGTDFRHTNFLGWLDDAHYLISHSSDDCPNRNIDAVAVADGSRSTLFRGCYDYYDAFSPQDGAVLFSSETCASCPLGEGTFLFVPGKGDPQRIWDEKAWGIEWLPESGVFDVYPLGAVTADGSQRFDPPAPEPSGVAVSAQGWVAWLELADEGWRVVIERPGTDPIVQNIPLGAMIWDPINGNTLVGATDGTVYALTSPDFSPREMGELGDGADRSIWVP